MVFQTQTSSGRASLPVISTVSCVAGHAAGHVDVHVGVACGVLVDPDVGRVVAVGPLRATSARKRRVGLDDVPVDRGACTTSAPYFAISSCVERTPSSHGARSSRRGRRRSDGKRLLRVSSSIASRAALPAVHQLQARARSGPRPRSRARPPRSRRDPCRRYRPDAPGAPGSPPVSPSLVEDGRVHVVVGQVAAAVLRIVAHEARRPGPSRRPREFSSP